ncbi:MAG: carbonic anhydrase [Bacillota bacterium]|nr:carbonic anhydrase [Bacillota bacterium]
MSNHGNFVTTVNCMDGRVQIPVNEYLTNKYKADYVDTITEAGPNKILAENINKTLVNSIKDRLEISINKHKSTTIAMVGHYDCGGNPAKKDEQILQIKESIELIKTWFNNVEIIGLWVDHNWKVNEL